ncbi:MAG: murein biosynthesis integral membrane protein MurJ, partial [Acidobacteria bacterium]|nr:murein biosynthesis integral membrane protein MurJ [Acidobacteriota bacterium]
NQRIGRTGLSAGYLLRLWSAAAAGAAVAWGIKLALGRVHPLLAGGCILTPYGGVYLAAAWFLGIEEVRTLAARLRR